MLASIVLSSQERSNLMLVERQIFQDAIPETILICYECMSSKPATTFHIIKKCGMQLIQKSRKSLKILRKHLFEVGVFDFSDSTIVTITDARRIEDMTLEPIMDIIGTRITSSMGYRDVIALVRREGDLINDVRLVFKLRSGQMVELGPAHGQWVVLPELK